MLWQKHPFAGWGWQVVQRPAEVAPWTQGQHPHHPTSFYCSSRHDSSERDRPWNPTRSDEEKKPWLAAFMFYSPLKLHVEDPGSMLYSRAVPHPLYPETPCTCPFQLLLQR